MNASPTLPLPRGERIRACCLPPYSHLGTFYQSSTLSSISHDSPCQREASQQLSKRGNPASNVIGARVSNPSTLQPIWKQRRPFSPRLESRDHHSPTIMSATRAKKSKIAHYASRLAVESEPGLTSAQLMLYNHDLAPVEPERRQWGMFGTTKYHDAVANVSQAHGILLDSGSLIPSTSTPG